MPPTSLKLTYDPTGQLRQPYWANPLHLCRQTRAESLPLYKSPEMRGDWVGIEAFIETFYASQDLATIEAYSGTVVVDMNHELSVPIDVLPFLRILASAPNFRCEFIYHYKHPRRNEGLKMLIWAISRRWSRIVRMGDEQCYVHDVSGEQENFLQRQHRANWYRFWIGKVLLHPHGCNPEAEVYIKPEHARSWMTAGKEGLDLEEKRQREYFEDNLGLVYLRARVLSCDVEEE